MFVQRGPIHTFKRALRLFKENWTELTSATDMIEQRVLLHRTASLHKECE